MPADWDPEQYERFRAQRARPFWDLAALVRTDTPIRRMVDLGCGTGELTAALADRLGADDVTGIDSSAAMLERAAAHATDGRRFIAGDIATWTSAGDHDLVVSNAAVHWVPDHHGVVANWAAAVAPGGQLAVQVPANADHPAHAAAGRVAARDPYLSALGGDPPPDPVAGNVLRPEQYARLLHDLGFVDQHVRLQVYGHVLPSTAAIVEWMRGSTLTRFFRLLPADLHDPFVADLTAAVEAEIGVREPVFFPFKRILLWGRRENASVPRGPIE